MKIYCRIFFYYGESIRKLNNKEKRGRKKSDTMVNKCCFNRYNNSPYF